jgi:type IV pilus assembly protein PilN
MIRINLLQERKAPAPGKTKTSSGPSVPGAVQAYALLALFAGGAAFVSAGLWWYQSSKIKELDRLIAADTKRQQDLMAIKKQVDEFQAKKTLLENKVTLIETLRIEQKGPVHMLDEISKALPDFVWLNAMDQNAAGGLKFKGEANGLTAVADFISALQRSGWFPTADLGMSVASAKDTNLVSFEVNAVFKDPEVAAKEKVMKERAAAAAAAEEEARKAKKGRR